MLNQVNDILQNNLNSERDFTNESKTIIDMIKNNKHVENIYLIERLQIILMISYSFIDYNICETIFNKISEVLV